MRRFRRIVVVLGLLALALWWFLPKGGPHIASGSALVLELSGEYVEAAEPPLLARLLGDGRHSFVALLSDLRKAERDDRLAVVVLRVRDLDIGWAKAQELRAALGELRAHGRRVIAYLETTELGANVEYYVATAADEIRAAPATRSPVIGLAAEYIFLGGLWDKLGVDVEVEKAGEFKGAAETLSERQMSAPNREMANSLLDSIDAQFVAGIAEGRKLTPEVVRRAIDEAPVSPEQLKAVHLIDGIQFWDELVAELGGKQKLVEAEDYARVDPKSLGFAPVARFALIYGSGNVVVGRGSASRSGSPIFASDTVSEALAEAAEDANIQAIILRIDSPGGSPLAADQVWRAARRARAGGKPRDRLVLGRRRIGRLLRGLGRRRDRRAAGEPHGLDRRLRGATRAARSARQARRRRRDAHARQLRLAAARLAAALRAHAQLAPLRGRVDLRAVPLACVGGARALARGRRRGGAGPGVDG